MKCGLLCAEDRRNFADLETLKTPGGPDLKAVMLVISPGILVWHGRFAGSRTSTRGGEMNRRKADIYVGIMFAALFAITMIAAVVGLQIP